MMPRPVQNSYKSHDILSRNNNIWIQCVRCWASSSFLPRRSAREFAPPNCPTGISSNDATSHWVGVRLPFAPPPDHSGYSFGHIMTFDPRIGISALFLPKCASKDRGPLIARVVGPPLPTSVLPPSVNYGSSGVRTSGSAEGGNPEITSCFGLASKSSGRVWHWQAGRQTGANSRRRESARARPITDASRGDFVGFVIIAMSVSRSRTVQFSSPVRSGRGSGPPAGWGSGRRRTPGRAGRSTELACRG